MAFEYAHPSVLATLDLWPGQCCAVLDEAPWRCQETQSREGSSWCAEHHAAYLRPPEPRRRTSERPDWRRGRR